MDTADSAGASQSQSQAAVAEQNWKLLSLYNYYRLIISLSAAVLALSGAAVPPFGLSSPDLFLIASITYAIVSLVSLETIRRQRPDFETQATFQIFADITLITFLMHASGGLSSGLGLLLLVAVAGSSLMLGKKMTVLYAALATIAALVEHSWDWWTGAEVNVSQVVQGYPQVGMLGIGLFATATLGYTLATRLRATEALAERRGVDLANLSQLNALIIKRMHSGVLVCDRDGRIRMMNQTAATFLGLPGVSMKSGLASASAELANHLAQSLANPTRRTRSPVKTRRGYTVIPRFIVLGEPPNHTGTLIFLEDAAVLKQQAQQLKMAALARLTASIAHEIRNPLGSMQLYVQMLAEDLREEPKQMEICRKIDRAVVSLDEIVRDVLLFARDFTINIQPLKTDELLDRALEHCEAIITRSGVTVIRETKEVFDLQADQTLMTQALSNVLRNAVEAMTDSSSDCDDTELRLTVAYRRVRCPDGQRRQRVVFGVEDTGPGISEDVVKRMFNPFFTTRATGTGLGLAIVHRIVEAHGGHVAVSAGRSRGTRIELCLQSSPSSCDRISGSHEQGDCEASEAYVETFTRPNESEYGP